MPMTRTAVSSRLAKPLIVFGLCATAAAAQTQAGSIKAAYDALNRGRYLEAADHLAGAAFDERGGVRDQVGMQLWKQFSPFVTNELDLAVLDRLDGGKAAQPEPGHRTRIASARPRDAIAEIVRRARATSIVVLNEAHHSPRDRAFALEVARALRPLGYSVLAAEAFTNVEGKASQARMERLAADGFVRLDTGHYTKDPVFADFVREAMAIGYRPVAYEQTRSQDPPGSGVEAREQAQADNLMAHIFARDPKARVLIFVGHSHVTEAPAPKSSGGTTEWMAARLKRMTGIDPLTIDQTGLTDLSSATRSAYAQAARRVGMRPGLLFDGDRPLVLGLYAGLVDLEVVHPRRAYRHGRPTWLARTGRKPVQVPSTMLPKAGRRLIQAFALDAPADAVPLDQVLVTAGSPAPKLMLRTERVRYAVQP